MMADSGARGSAQQMRQLAGMRGLMAKPSGEIIETPITSNFREGLSVLQYFISTHGARKGLADTALKTANSGYLTRRLVDVAQDMIIRLEDCGTEDGLEIGAARRGRRGDRADRRAHPGPRGARRTSSIPVNGEVIVRAGEEIDEEKVALHRGRGHRARHDPLGAHLRNQASASARCATGATSSRGEMVNLGEAVGVIAAQSIGEPGTQLTMRTFHIGGAATRRAEQSQRRSAHRGRGALRQPPHRGGQAGAPDRQQPQRRGR